MQFSSRRWYFGIIAWGEKMIGWYCVGRAEKGKERYGKEKQHTTSPPAIIFSVSGGSASFFYVDGLLCCGHNRSCMWSASYSRLYVSNRCFHGSSFSGLKIDNNAAWVTSVPLRWYLPSMLFMCVGLFLIFDYCTSMLLLWLFPACRIPSGWRDCLPIFSKVSLLADLDVAHGKPVGESGWKEEDQDWACIHK